MQTISVLAVLALAFTCTLAFNETLNQSWKTWKGLHKKEYSDRDDNVRRGVWESNLKKVQGHNLEADRGVHTYRLGINAYADLTNEEFVKQMNGYKAATRSEPSRNRRAVPSKSTVNLPSSVDWRTKGYVTRVKDQGQCGSCWAFSTTGALEGQRFAKNRQVVSLSEQNLVDCSWQQGNMGCNGGSMNYAFQYIKVNNGIDTEISYPYEARNKTCRFKSTNVGATVTGYINIQSKNESALQQAVATVGSISVAIDASHSSFQFYQSGIYNELNCSSTNLDHAVLVVGYSSQSGSDFWIVKNSWGTSWGNQGYIMMSRNKNNQCGIATAASYPTV